MRPFLLMPKTGRERPDMRVIHVTNYFRGIHGHVGGAEQACYRTALAARGHGCSILVVTTRPDRSPDTEFEWTSLPILEDYAPAAIRPYIEAVKWYALQFDPPAIRAFRKILDTDAGEIVHFHNFQFLTLSLMAAAKAAARRTVVSIYDYWLFCPTVMLVGPDKAYCTKAHGTWCTDCLPQKLRSFQWLLLSMRRKIVDHYLRMVDAFHVLSEHSAGVLRQYGIPAEKIHVVPLTLPTEFRNEPVSQAGVEPHSILFAGWLNERKGLHRLLEAMPLVLEAFPDARLTAVGGKVRFGDEYQRLLDDLLDRNGLRDRVTFTGHLEPAAVQEYLAKSEVVVIPEQYDNMSPLLMIEAMTMAKPVVISRAGGIPEFIADGVTGRLADPLDPRDFADKIIRVFRDPAASMTMGAAARKRIMEKCDDETIWERTAAMYGG